MNALDLTLFALVLLLAIRAAFRGFVTEALSVAAPFVAGWAALAFFEPLGASLERNAGTGGASGLIAFAMLFITAFIVVKVVEGILDRALEATNLDQLDHLLGLVLGCAEGLLLGALILLVMDRQPFIGLDSFLDGSWCARTVLPLLASAVPGAS